MTSTVIVVGVLCVTTLQIAPAGVVATVADAKGPAVEPVLELATNTIVPTDIALKLPLVISCAYVVETALVGAVPVTEFAVSQTLVQVIVAAVLLMGFKPKPFGLYGLFESVLYADKDRLSAYKP